MLQIKNALLDITRAIHLRPDMQHLYMYRVRVLTGMLPQGCKFHFAYLTHTFQGQLVHKLGQLDLAAFCVKHASELNSGLGQSPTQQAIVHSFLKNYDKVIDLFYICQKMEDPSCVTACPPQAIEALQAATRMKPVPPLYLLLGKTQMKAQLWEGAIQSFSTALNMVVSTLKLLWCENSSNQNAVHSLSRCRLILHLVLSL